MHANSFIESEMAEYQSELGFKSDESLVFENSLKYSPTSVKNVKNELQQNELKLPGNLIREIVAGDSEKVLHKMNTEEQTLESVKNIEENNYQENSQSIKLILEDTEGNDESKIDNKDESAKYDDNNDNKQKGGLNNKKVKSAEPKNLEQINDIELLKINAKEESNKKNKIIKKMKKNKTNLATENYKIEYKVIDEDIKDNLKDDIKIYITNDTSHKEEMLKGIETKENFLKNDENSKENIGMEIDWKEKIIESEIGIVGPPTVASELLNEEELVIEKPALPTNYAKDIISDRVVRWVENTTAKVNDPATKPAVERNDMEKEDVNVEDKESHGPIIKNCRSTRGKKRRHTNGTNSTKEPSKRKSQKVVTNIIRRSIRCLNKIHVMENSSSNGKQVIDSLVESKRVVDEDDSRKSPKVPQSQQNGAALPEETASSDRNLLHFSASSSFLKKEKKESLVENDSNQLQISQSSKLQVEHSTTTITGVKQSMPSPPPPPPPPPPTMTTTVTMTTMTSKQGKVMNQRGVTARHHYQQQHQQEEHREQPSRETRKRRSTDTTLCTANTGGVSLSSSNGSSSPKKLYLDQREQFINSLIGSDKFTMEQLATRAEQLRAEVQDLDELARAKEMEWNEILSMRKLKEEAYLRIERRRQIMGFMESNGSMSGDGFLPPASLVLAQQNYDRSASPQVNVHVKDKGVLVVPKEERGGSLSRDSSPALKRERTYKVQSSYLQSSISKHQVLTENGSKQILDAQSPEHRQIGEGRQGPIVDVRSIIADYRLRHPETVPRRRGRRMRNSVNVGLGAGGAMVETVGNMDSRPSSTDSCKSNSNVSDPNNAMSFKDVLVQFAKLSQQQGEPIKTPQNYPDVTLHPVAVPPTSQTSVSQSSGSLLHGILTKSQSPRPTTFSPTLARLLTAPERERNAPTIAPTPHQTATQHLLQTYQGTNPVSISDFLSSSKARTEITITPVVNNPIQINSNNLINVDDVQEDTSIIDERDSKISMGNRDNRDNRDDRDSPPRCQGCHERAAQFVCAGCGNQWYCSRECQVAAWDEHSEVCSG